MTALGSIEGAVVSDEILPLENVVVTLVNLDVQAATGPDGQYRFERVPVGSQQVSVNKPGYMGQLRQVNVEENRHTVASFILLTLAQHDPYSEVHHHVAFHHLTNYMVSSSLSQDLCEACVWTLRTDERPHTIFVEASGRHTVPAILVGDSIGLHMVAVESGAVLIPWTVYYYPVSMGVTGQAVSSQTEFQFTVNCQWLWVCVQEKTEFWVTVSYGRGVPEGYTAIEEGPS